MATSPDREASSTHKFWAKTLKSWKSRAKDQRKSYERLAKAYRTMYYPRGEQGNSDGLDFDNAVTVESNYLYAFADTLVANITPPNPTVTIKSSRKEWEDSAKLREVLTNTVFEQEDLASKLWKLCSRSTIWPRSFLKVVWSKTRNRPIFRVINPHYIFFDIAAEDWEDLRYICEVTVLTKQEFMARVKQQGKKGGYYRKDADEGVVFGSFPKWLEPDDDEPDSGTETQETKVARGAYQWAVVYELYDLKNNKFYHFADDVALPLFEDSLPYRFMPNPYHMLAFNDNLRDLGGISDAELVYPTLERLNEMTTLEMIHCKTSIPTTLVHEGLMDDPDAFMDAFLESDRPGQVISMDAKPGVGIDQVIGHTPIPTLPIEWGRAQQSLIETVNFVLGLPAYSRGGAGASDVATELALIDTATRTRNARRQKAVYNVISWAAKAVISLYQEFLPTDAEIPVQVGEGKPETVITRELLAFGEKNEDPWGYRYSANPYSANEQNDVVQLKQFEVFLPVLLQAAAAGHIDMRKLVKKLLGLLHMSELLSEQPPPPPMMPGQGMGVPGAEQGPEGPTMPGNMPAEAAAPMMGGQVASGTGAQAIPTGVGGGKGLTV